jgi:glycosyltransferase involved in cell wall biosynthesis
MNKVLLLAYHYPPLGGPGVFRTLKFTKYLPKFDYQPFILTVKNPLYKLKDSSLMAEIPIEANVSRVFSFEHKLLRVPRLININLKWFYLPDEHIGWLPFAVFYGSKLIKKEDIEVIFATSPSYTTLLLGSLLKKKTKIPLVVDFRDLWVNNSFIEYPARFHKFIESKMEKHVLAQADYITVVSDLIRDDLIRRYPFVRPKIETLTNGFDPEDFEELDLQKESRKFRIAYTGSIYGGLTARTFLSALKKLVIENEELKKNIEVVFVGNYGKETQSLVGELSLEENVKLKGYVSHKKSLDLIAGSNVLLLLITVLGSKGKEILTGKIFEYLASKKPIIAIAPEDNLASKLIKSLDAGVIVPPRNVELVKEAILLFYKKWKDEKLLGLAINSNELQKFNRINLTQRLSRIFDKVKK